MTDKTIKFWIYNYAPGNLFWLLSARHIVDFLPHNKQIRLLISFLGWYFDNQPIKWQLILSKQRGYYLWNRCILFFSMFTKSPFSVWQQKITNNESTHITFYRLMRRIQQYEYILKYNCTSSVLTKHVYLTSTSEKNLLFISILFVC